MKTHWALGLVLGLSGLASFAVAGPNVKDPRALLYQAPAKTERSVSEREVVRWVARELAPLVGSVRAPELTRTDATSLESFANAAGEPDATVFCDFTRDAVVALDATLHERPELLSHEAARLVARDALGARLPAWLEEGLACCVQDAWLQDEELGAERADSDRHARARSELRSGASLERLFALEPTAFARGERVHRDVALAWATTRQLLRTSRGRRALAAAFDALRATHSSDAAQRALLTVFPAHELERSLAYSR